MKTEKVTGRWVVYTIVNKKTGHQYHGQTMQDVHTRFKAHLLEAAKGSNTKLARAIREQGAENFDLAGWIGLGERFQNEDVLDDLERLMIKNTNSIQDGYNMTKGGTHTRKSPKPEKREKVTIWLDREQIAKLREWRNGPKAVNIGNFIRDCVGEGIAKRETEEGKTSR